ncbi:MAG: glycosyltransferase [Bacteroidota bacterium]
MKEQSKLLIIIVLYKKQLLESSTYQSLKKACYDLKEPVNVLVYDNSPAACPHPIENEQNILITHLHDQLNSGLCKAYNTGIDTAKEKDLDWLLLLDQDTFIPSDYLNVFYNTEPIIAANDVVCAVPKVLAPGGSQIISPIKIYFGAIFRTYKNVKAGVLAEKITGINSGTFLSVKYIDELGGFDSRFSLDMLDHWYFSEIAAANRRVFLLDATIYHNLSVNSFENEVSLDRYARILDSEKIFSKKNVFSYLVFKLRLLKRLIEQRSYKEKEFFYMTLKNLI